MAYNFKRLSEVPEGQVVDDGYVLGVQGGEIVRYPVSGLQSSPGGMVVDAGLRKVYVDNVRQPALDGDYETVLAHLLAGGTLWARVQANGIVRHTNVINWRVVPSGDDESVSFLEVQIVIGTGSYSTYYLPSDPSLLLDPNAPE